MWVRSAMAVGLAAAVVTACQPESSRAPEPVVQIQPSPTVIVTPQATPVTPDPRVGAVFLGGETVHTCTATVLNSATGDLILTAAHCLADGYDTTFVPGYDTDLGIQDSWHVDAVYLDQRWLAARDPHADFAIARVSREAGGSVAAHGGVTLGTAPRDGTQVSVTGYAMGDGGSPTGCLAVTGAPTAGYPSLACAGLVAGFSGAPWIHGSTVVGIIGGLDGGGCDVDMSYSPPFDGAVQALLTRAEAEGPADAAPVVDDDGC